MFFILSKILSIVISPLFWIFGLLLSALFVKESRKKNKRLLFGIAVFLFFITPIFSNWLTEKWEYTATNEIHGKYDVAVVLTGMTLPTISVDNQLQLSFGAERIIEPIKLYHAGKVKKILISGGSGNLSRQDLSESPALMALAIQLGVDPKDILVEKESKNTYENAVNSTLIINEEYANQSVLLVTSSFHMRRSKACFEKQGLNVTPYPVDFNAEPIEMNFYFLHQGTGSLHLWNLIIHEIVGYATYYVLGYL